MVTDVDGNRYIDCTAAFGVANAGHCNPQVTAAVLEQVERLVHGMGDVHPSAVRVRLFERLSQILPKGLDKIFRDHRLRSDRSRIKDGDAIHRQGAVAAYRGGYHGLSFGALAVGGIERLRAPFAAALGAEPMLLDFPSASGNFDAERRLRRRIASFANETTSRRWS